MVAELQALYHIPDPEPVEAFLTGRADLLPYLVEIPERVRDVAGPIPFTLMLEHHEDPEEDFEYLVVTARVPGTVDSHMELLNAFDDTWWLDVPADVCAAVVVTVATV